MEKKSEKIQVKFPMNILKPIKDYLVSEKRRILHTKRDLSKEDPFADVSRLNDNASPDTDAAEQVGHARVSALKTELDRKLIQIKKALTQLKIGKYGICENCGKMISTDRLMVKPEATTCIECEKKKAAKSKL